jgi:FkbM family methyltransferase
MECATFTNDDFVSILLINHVFSEYFKTRDNHEVLFRKINTFLIKNNLIRNNIVDLGAWIGDNSIPWAKNSDGVVYAIDPSNDNCEFINKTCEVNKISNVKVIQCAISNSNELLTTNDSINHCSFVYGNAGLNGQNKVNAVSLDYLYGLKTIENVGYIHLDVEGMEYKVLEGSSKLIDECRPIISFEQHLEIDDYNIILSYLKNKDYSVFLVDEILIGCRDDCRNSFAFPNETFNETLIENIHSYIGKNILIPK